MLYYFCYLHYFLQEAFVQMISKKKIATMAKLAIYDKHFGVIDRKTSEYFRYDYIYRRNTTARIFVACGLVILFLFYMGYKIFVEQINLMEIDLKVFAYKIIFFGIAVLIFYTGVSYIQALHHYNNSQKRLRKYYITVHSLDKPKEKRKRGSQDGSNFTNERSHH